MRDYIDALQAPLDVPLPGAIDVLVPIKVVSVLNQREHWAARARRAKLHRESTYHAMRAEALFSGTTGPLEITLTRIAPRLLDDDNAIAGLKAARDGIADWLGRDDGDQLLTWRYGQQKGAYGVRVTVRAT